MVLLTIGKGTEQSLSDEWHTPKDLYKYICRLTGLNPRLDVAATASNSRCKYYFTKKDNALKQEWLIKAGTKKTGVWCNPPGKYVQKMVNKATQQWIEKNLNILMLIPANTITNREFEGVWTLFQNGYVDIIPLFGIRPKFLLEGEVVLDKKGKPQGARNGFIVLVFRKR